MVIYISVDTGTDQIIEDIVQLLSQLTEYIFKSGVSKLNISTVYVRYDFPWVDCQPTATSDRKAVTSDRR